MTEELTRNPVTAIPISGVPQVGGEPLAELTSRPMDTQHRVLVALVAAAGLTLYAGWYATMPWRSFYEGLIRPGWALPAAGFAPVWGVMLLSLPASTWLAIRHDGFLASMGVIALFLLLLFVNVLWQLMVFGRHFGSAAMLLAVLQVVVAAVHLAALHGLKRGSVVVAMPYVGWLLYLCALTASLWHRNPALL